MSDYSYSYVIILQKEIKRLEKETEKLSDKVSEYDKVKEKLKDLHSNEKTELIEYMTIVQMLTDNILLMYCEDDNTESHTSIESMLENFNERFQRCAS